MRLLESSWYPLAFAAYPVLSLLASNIREVDPAVAMRPMLLSLAGAWILVGGLRILAGSWREAALIGSLCILTFFSYGHIYSAVKNEVLFGVVIGRHRYLLPALGFLLVAFAVWVTRWKGSLARQTRILNLVGFALLVLPVLQLGRFAVQAEAGIRRVEAARAASPQLSLPASGYLPDIYYIVLDGYTRADALEGEFGFDNSAFVDSLVDLGFYVAECSRSNYAFTISSLAAALNMDYLIAWDKTSKELGSEINESWGLLRHSLVRRYLEDAGYMTIAFDTGHQWSRFTDADIYLSLEGKPLLLQELDPFESLLANSTAAMILAHREIQVFAGRAQAIDDHVPRAGFPLERYVEGQLFILDQLPEIPKIRRPTFAFVHLLTTHVPYVFTPEGDIWDDEGFYYGATKEPADEWHLQVGYLSAIEYTNLRMLEILRTIIAESQQPPIIVMHGDHGLRDENRLQILNAYYLPPYAKHMLYPHISPVNSFRVVFDGVFGTSLGLLEDLSYMEGAPEPEPETSPACLEAANSRALD